MKKTFTVAAFDAYDYTQECSVCSEYCKTIADAENEIETDDAERHERWRQSMFYNHGRLLPNIRVLKILFTDNISVVLN